MIERHTHHFQVADIGAWDLDEDRSIAPSIHNCLKASGIVKWDLPAIVNVTPSVNADHVSQRSHQTLGSARRADSYAKALPYAARPRLTNAERKTPV